MIDQLPLECGSKCVCTAWRPILYSFLGDPVHTCVCGHAKSQHTPAAVAAGS